MKHLGTKVGVAYIGDIDTDTTALSFDGARGTLASVGTTHTGRIYAVITTPNYIYVLEFKLGDAASALAQIKAKGYHLKYLASGKQVILLGIGFDTEKRNVGGYLVEVVA